MSRVIAWGILQQAGAKYIGDRRIAPPISGLFLLMAIFGLLLCFDLGKAGVGRSATG